MLHWAKTPDGSNYDHYYATDAQVNIHFQLRICGYITGAILTS